MLRALLAVVGLVELLRPRETVDFWMTLAVEDPDAVELRPWVYTVARVEGALLLLWALRGRRAAGGQSE
jgi:hypothetical protein